MVTNVPTQSQIPKSTSDSNTLTNCNCRFYVISAFVLGTIVGAYITKQFFTPSFARNINLERVNPGINYIIDIS